MGRQLLAGTLTMNALLVLSIFISQSLGQASAECPTPTIGNCSTTDYRCDLGSVGSCWLGSFCMPEGSICPLACNTPAPSNCSAGELTCDIGVYGGCWMGDFCHEDKDGFQCPPVCNIPAPSICQDGEIMCDMGIDADYCWMGDYCMPAGSECPAPAQPTEVTESPSVCPNHLPSNCTTAEDFCDMGWDTVTGCWMGDYCMPKGTCPVVCNTPTPSQCMEGEVTCDMGTYSGCWMGDFCMAGGFPCPPVCNIPAPSICQDGEIMCDMGIDANYCWMGDYCMPAGSECPAPAGV